MAKEEFAVPTGHRPGAFKQPNKSHKSGRHRSKGQIDQLLKGRSDVKLATKSKKGEQSRMQRKNQLNDIRKNKREEAIARKRALGGVNVPPFLVTIVNLTGYEKLSTDLISLVTSCDAESSQVTSQNKVTYLSVPRFKQRFSFVTPRLDLVELCDCLKVADTALIIWPLSDELPKESEAALSCILAQGLPSTVHVAPGLSILAAKHKKDRRKSLTKIMEKWSFEAKFQTADSPSDGLNILRCIGLSKKRHLVLQERRPHLIVDYFEQNSDSLDVYGYVRGPPLSVNGLVHVAGWGDFQMSRVELVSEREPLAEIRDMSDVRGDKTISLKYVAVSDPVNQWSIDSEVEPDPMEGEQTWPTKAELDEAEAVNNDDDNDDKTTRKVPKGTSDYQACWIVDDADNAQQDGVSSDEDDSDQDEMGEEIDGLSVDDESDSECSVQQDGVTPSDDQMDTDTYDARIDTEEEIRLLERFRAQREDEMFPDEVDTPKETPAHIRFQKYRGLKSFRTSPWDPKEGLPEEYSRIFQFQNFLRTRKRVVSTLHDDGAQHGWYVKISISNTEPAMAEHFLNGARPMIVFGLLEHEQKMSTLNMVIRRKVQHSDSNEDFPSIKSKDALIFQVGFRRFEARPIFSQHTNAAKHKFERFLPKSSNCVATVFAPIIYPPASVLMFRRNNFSGKLELLATGGVLNVNPDRVITRRIVLSGHPYKINERTVIVRYMFFNREDVQWFKPVELHTKYGRRGHIKEGIGTHGHMKCQFDGKLISQDTVLMNLYKRVFPKWHYEAKVDMLLTGQEGNMDEN